MTRAFRAKSDLFWVILFYQFCRQRTAAETAVLALQCLSQWRTRRTIPGFCERTKKAGAKTFNLNRRFAAFSLLLGKVAVFVRCVPTHPEVGQWQTKVSGPRVDLGRLAHRVLALGPLDRSLLVPFREDFVPKRSNIRIQGCGSVHRAFPVDPAEFPTSRFPLKRFSFSEIGSQHIHTGATKTSSQINHTRRSIGKPRGADGESRIPLPKT